MLTPLRSVLQAALDGIDRAVPLPPPATDLDPAVVEAMAPEQAPSRLPTSLAEAIAALEADELLRGALGPRLARAYIAVKRHEVDNAAAGIAEEAAVLASKGI